MPSGVRDPRNFGTVRPPSPRASDDRIYLATRNHLTNTTNTTTPTTTMLRPGLLLLLRPVSKSAVQTTRPFSTRPFSSFRPNVLQALGKRSSFTSGNFFRPGRTLLTDSTSVVARPSKSEAWKKYAVTAVSSLWCFWSCSFNQYAQATVAGTVVAVNVFLNRETRDSLTPAERSYLNDSFKYTGGGLVLTAIAARSMFRSGFAFRVMSANPWLVLGVSLVGSIGTMMGAMYTSPENTVLKHAFWLVRSQWATSSNFFVLK